MPALLGVSSGLSFRLLIVLFAIAVTAHNLEEAILLPNWSKSTSKWVKSVGTGEFHFAVAFLTVLAYLAGALAFIGPKDGLAAYFVCGYALAMLLNVIFPHLVATFAFRRYAPGTGTAVMLNLPVTSALLWRGFAEEYVQLPRFLLLGLPVVLGITGAIPLLFRMSRWWNSARAARAARPVRRSVSNAQCLLEQSPASQRSAPSR